MTMINVILFIFVSKLSLSPGIVVLSIGLYTRLATSIGNRFTESLSCLVSAKVSFNRINKFLLLDEIDVHNRMICNTDDIELNDPKSNNEILDENQSEDDEDENENENEEEEEDEIKIYKEKDDNGNQSNKIEDDYAIIVKDFNFSWSLNSKFSLKEINFKVKMNGFQAIVGPVGSGKTTLILGILGELEKYSGSINVKGKVYHISQQPWIFTASIRQNILFGMEYDEKKFNKIIDVCSLRKVNKIKIK